MTPVTKNPIDAHVGSRVKLRRKVVGITQTELARQLGITFQQVQKYENGANRISASRLYLMAEILNAPIESFFEGAEAVVENPPEAYAGAEDKMVEKYEDFIRSPGGIDFCKTFVSIDSSTVRKQISALLKTISASQQH
jgi:transcriptional regulator with XRE-family HTH domain